MENINIYDDVSNVDLGNEIHKLEDQNRQLLQHIRKLEVDIEKLCSELSNMKKIQQNLSKNISELYKTAKLEIQRKDRIISELREEIDKLSLRKRGIVTSVKREICEEEGDRPYQQNDNKRFKNDLCEEDIAPSVLDKKIYISGRSTSDMSEDHLHFRQDKVNCKQSGNDHRYISRYALQRNDSTRNKRNDRYNPRDQDNNDRYRRGRSHERSNRSRSHERSNRSRSRDKYKRSRSTNRYRRSRSSNRFRRSRSSNKSDDLKRKRRSKSRDKYSISKNSYSENLYDDDFAFRSYKNESYNDEKTLIDIKIEKTEMSDIAELEEGEIRTETSNNLIIEETSTSKSDIKSITIQEYRNRIKIISNETESNLKIEDSNKDAQITDSNISKDSIKNENVFLDNINTDIIPYNEGNSKIINIDTTKSSTVDNVTINTSICSSSSENTSFNMSGTNNGLKARRRRCVVIGIKEKV